MTFQQLKYAVEVAKCRSINKAASNLFVSQSSISSALKELESELAISIFTRSNQGVELTSEGRQFLSQANSLIQRYEYIQSLYASEQVASELQFSISTQRYPFAVDAFVQLVNRIDDPRFNLTIRETSMDKVIDDIYTSVSDIGVIFTSNLTEKMIKRFLQTRNIEFHLVKKIQPCVYVRKGHPLSGSLSLKAEQLTDYIYMAFEHKQGESIDFSEEFNLIASRQPNKVIVVNDRATAVNIVCNTDAVSTGSGLLVKEFMDDRIMSIPLEGYSDKMNLGWIKLKNRQLGEEGALFVNLLHESIEKAILFTEKVRAQSRS
ncbi:LysR family transcriptional regulator [Paenibacillus paeoniae]|uniref:LysR family transcriptional regulator n=1 Tax=Paenibacillus paeoniae TaxID=2292705 RepID=A0A371PKJ9_9BACL|nr:LysR family transcriptional regulator [Paenibacillus paeoniae]REK76716.1 LysR family transcriptional regulator [Paenibacillus paeoniae]